MTDLEIKSNLLARLNRMPMTKTVFGVIVLLAIVWLAEAFDIGVIGPVIPQLEKTWNLQDSETGLLGIASTIGVVVGMIPSGILADTIGRKKTVLWGILFFSVLTLLGAFVSNFKGLITVRFLAGIGEGAVLPMPYLYLSEFVQTKRRAVAVGFSNGVLTAAYIVPNVVALWALHAFSQNVAWRIPFVMGAIPLLFVVPLHLWLPESPRFLLKQGRHTEVELLVNRLETEARLPHDSSLRETLPYPSPSARANRLLHRPYLLRGVMVILQLTGALMLFYVLQVYGPRLLISEGFHTGSSIFWTGMMMLTAGFGSVVQGFLAEWYGRRITLSLYVGLASLGCILFAIANDGVLISLVAGALTAFFGLGIFPVSKLCVAEQLPTTLRGEGVYFGEMISRTLSGGVTLYFVPFLMDTLTTQNLFILIAVCLVVLALPFLVFGRETYRMNIDEAGAPRVSKRYGTRGNI